MRTMGDYGQKRIKVRSFTLPAVRFMQFTPLTIRNDSAHSHHEHEGGKRACHAARDRLGPLHHYPHPSNR
jgi:hypothetical protein